jgi:hypothetical protein
LIVVSSAVSAGASAGVALIISGRSPPAKNVLFALVTITPVRLSRSASSRSTAAVMDAA